MTEIIAFSLSKAARPQAHRRENKNPGVGDGWSVLHFPDRGVQVVKEIGPIEDESCLERYLELNPHGQGRTFVFHASRSRTRRTPSNVGPFERHLGNRVYSVSFQGTMNGGARDTGRQRFQPVGDTPQEAAACQILSAIDRRGITEWKPEDYAWLRRSLQSASRGHGFNAMICHGDTVACYHEANGPPLSFRKLNPASPEYECEMMHVDWSKGKQSAAGFVVSSAADRLGGDWQQFEPDELLVFHQGQIVYFDAKQR